MVNRNILFLFALILAAFNLRPGITSVSPVLHGITKELGMSSTSASLLTSIPLLCFGFCSLFAGRLANRYQSEKVITFFIACIGIATFLRVFTNSSLYLLITAFINWGRNWCCKSFTFWFHQKLLPREGSIDDRHIFYFNGSGCIHFYRADDTTSTLAQSFMGKWISILEYFCFIRSSALVDGNQTISYSYK